MSNSNEIKSRGPVSLQSESEVQTSVGVQTSPIKTEYFEIDLGHHSVFARKWKAKDRKNFKKAIQVNNDLDKSIIETLVLNCLEDRNVALTYDEIQYILIELRKVSVSDKFTFKYTCGNCGTNHKLSVKIDDINKPLFKEWGEVGNVVLGEIANSKFYNDNKDESDEIKELAFHTKSVNGNNNLTFDEVIAYYDDMEINEFDEIIIAFDDMKFKIGNEKEFKCDCGNTQIYEFDEIPGFFPDSWLK
jgi:hypothetical protein